MALVELEEEEAERVRCQLLGKRDSQVVAGGYNDSSWVCEVKCGSDPAMGLQSRGQGVAHKFLQSSAHELIGEKSSAY